jgi:hypothetical protein
LKDKKKVKKEVLEIEGFIDNPIYEEFVCCCSQDPNDRLHKYPYQKCDSCHCKESLDNIPREPFDRVYPIKDKNGNDTGKTEIKHITKIKITVRDKKTDEILGYSVSSTNTF